MRVLTTILIISLTLASTAIQAQWYQKEQKTWSVGIEYKPFNYDLHNRAERYKRYKKVDEDQFLSAYYGISIERHLKWNFYVESGLGYSHQVFKYNTPAASLQDAETGETIEYYYNNKNIEKYDYIHIPINIKYRIPFNYKGDVGLQLNLGILNSISTYYYLEASYYDLDASLNVTDKVRISNITTSYKHKTIHYEDDGKSIKSLEKFETDYINKLYLIGIETGASLYFVIWDDIRFSPGMWYNYDIIETDRYNNNYHNIRWGFSLEIAYLF